MIQDLSGLVMDSPVLDLGSLIRTRITPKELTLISVTGYCILYHESFLAFLIASSSEHFDPFVFYKTSKCNFSKILKATEARTGKLRGNFIFG